MLEIPTWGLMLLIFAILIFTFLVFKMFGMTVKYSILIGLLVSDVVLLIVHSFEIQSGKIVPHDGDFFAGLYLLLSLFYYIAVGIYAIFFKLIRKWCCCCCLPPVKTTQEKIIDAYGPESDDLTKLLNPEVSHPIDIKIGTDIGVAAGGEVNDKSDYDRTGMNNIIL